MMVAVLFLGGYNCSRWACSANMFGRILTETKARPLYVIRERIGDD